MKDRIADRARRHAPQVLRYSAVSVIATSVSLTILGVLVATRSLSPGWANVVATAVATVPSFELNRRWVWAKAGPRSLHREAMPYFALTFTGLGVSTLLVSTATGVASAHHAGDAVRTAVALAANLVGFGSVWVAQYIVLDRLLFRHRPHDGPAGDAVSPGELVEA